MSASLEEKVAALQAQNEALAEQVKRLVRADRRLFLSQRDLERQLQRVAALSRFASEMSAAQEAPLILGRAMELLFAVLAFDQGVAFSAADQHLLVPVAVRALPGCEGNSVQALAAATSSCTLDAGEAPLVPQVMRGAGEGGSLLAESKRVLDALFGRCDAVEFSAVIPVGRPYQPPMAVLAMRRVSGPASFHEATPSEDDAGFFSLLSQQVSGTLTISQLASRERLAALGEVAAVIAHEVRNPLGAIYNSLEVLARQRLGPEAEFPIRLAREEAERLNQIVGNLMDYANPRLPSLRPESLEELVLGAAAGARDLPTRVSVTVSGPLPLVNGDARMLRQVFVNLMNNASRAAPARGEVTVRLSAGEHAGRPVVRVDMTDQGPGMPEQVVARVFEPFFTTRATGTGLGLALVKRFVDAHGGLVDVTSRPGEGCTFSVVLPVEAGSALSR